MGRDRVWVGRGCIHPCQIMQRKAIRVGKRKERCDCEKRTVREHGGVVHLEREIQPGRFQLWFSFRREIRVNNYILRTRY